MAVIQLNPRTPGQRFMQLADFSGLTAKPPEKRLLAPLKHSGGRNNRGRMTSRHRGGGHKRRLRLIDFKRNHDGVPAVVAALEYDPNRSANIALLHYADGEKRYILAPEGLKVGDKVESGPQADIKPGNALALKNIPLGTIVHAIELKPGAGAQWCAGPGTQAQLMAKEGKFALLKLPSGEQRMVQADCRATIGQVGNLDHENISIGKAGRSRWLGQASACARDGDEPGRPSAWRRRGPFQGQSSAIAVGTAGQGLQDARQEAFGPLHREPPAQGQALGGI